MDITLLKEIEKKLDLAKLATDSVIKVFNSLDKKIDKVNKLKILFKYIFHIEKPVLERAFKDNKMLSKAELSSLFDFICEIADIKLEITSRTHDITGEYIDILKDDLLSKNPGKKSIQEIFSPEASQLKEIINKDIEFNKKFKSEYMKIRSVITIIQRMVDKDVKLIESFSIKTICTKYSENSYMLMQSMLDQAEKLEEVDGSEILPPERISYM